MPTPMQVTGQPGAEAGQGRQPGTGCLCPTPTLHPRLASHGPRTHHVSQAGDIPQRLVCELQAPVGTPALGFDGVGEAARHAGLVKAGADGLEREDACVCSSGCGPGVAAGGGRQEEACVGRAAHSVLGARRGRPGTRARTTSVRLCGPRRRTRAQHAASPHPPA